MRFSCERYPHLTVCVGGERFISFAAGAFETDDEAIAAVLRQNGDITEIKEEKEEAKQTAKKKK